MNREYIAVEIDDVSFVRIILIAWGKKAIVVQNAATNPKIFIQSIRINLNLFGTIMIIIKPTYLLKENY